MFEIIHKNENFIICKKPVGVQSQKASNGGKSMIELIARELNIPEGEVHPVHRLDKLVGGTMVYAIGKEGAKKLSQIVSENRMQKRYLAVIHGRPEEDKGIFKDLLFKDSSKNKSYVVKRMRRGVKEASLEYEVIDTKETNGEKISLVRILLHTGRTHQIRVQFASRGMPLVGDRRYGSGKDNCPVALHSYSLEFINPFNNNNEEFISEPNREETPWDMFEVNWSLT